MRERQSLLPCQQNYQGGLDHTAHPILLRLRTQHLMGWREPELRAPQQIACVGMKPLKEVMTKASTSTIRRGGKPRMLRHFRGWRLALPRRKLKVLVRAAAALHHTKVALALESSPKSTKGLFRAALAGNMP